MQPTRAYCQGWGKVSGKRTGDACEGQQASPTMSLKNTCIVAEAAIRPKATVISGTVGEITVKNNFRFWLIYISNTTVSGAKNERPSFHSTILCYHCNNSDLTILIINSTYVQQ